MTTTRKRKRGETNINSSNVFFVFRKVVLNMHVVKSFKYLYIFFLSLSEFKKILIFLDGCLLESIKKVGTYQKGNLPY